MMFSVHSRNRTHKLQFLSYEEAVANLPKPIVKTNKNKNKVSAVRSQPISVAAETNKKNFSSFRNADSVAASAPYFSVKTAKERDNVVAKSRKREREAARNKLINLEKETDGRDNHQIFKEFEDLCGCHLAYECQNTRKVPYLESRFGLKLKQITKTEKKMAHHSVSATNSLTDHHRQQSPLNEKEEAALQYERLMTWIPPPFHNDEFEYDDWLFKPNRAKRQKVETTEVVDDDSVISSSCLQQPKATFLQQHQIYALPYTIPF